MVALPEGIKPNKIEGSAHDIAAKAVGVGGSVIQMALAVEKAGPIETDRIHKGQTTVEEAYRKVRSGQSSKRQELVEKALTVAPVSANLLDEGGSADCENSPRCLTHTGGISSHVG